ncbi:hypothetical protein DFP91_0816 [Pseudorhodoplanes sinuspersici]|nr:hypothetical protein DFP91_0816 [Pseudorhodoplanes sinuspersici]
MSPENRFTLFGIMLLRQKVPLVTLIKVSFTIVRQGRFVRGRIGTPIA